MKAKEATSTAVVNDWWVVFCGCQTKGSSGLRDAVHEFCEGAKLTPSTPAPLNPGVGPGKSYQAKNGGEPCVFKVAREAKNFL